MPYRILVCGGRAFADRALVFAALDIITPRTEPDRYGNDMPKDVTIIHGACQDRRGNLKGADAFADDWAVVNWCPVLEYPADWDAHGRAAGPIRNREMLKAKPDLVLAFEGGRGTADMTAAARKAGVQVHEVRWCLHPGCGPLDPNCVECLNKGVEFR